MRLQSEYRRSIAHELGHIVCDCTNEARAEQLAARLERGEPILDAEAKVGIGAISH